MAILVYALHRMLRGFQVLPVSHTSLNYPYDLISTTPLGVTDPGSEEMNAQVVSDFLKCLDLSTVNYSDLPDQIRENIKSALQDPKRLGTDVERELKRCLDVGSTSDFIRDEATDRALRISLRIGQHGRAPVVLFLRDVVRVGDTLVIEEPEAHLHPAAQTLMALTLARLVRAGVSVIVTTHSDWMLKEIANLMREGVLDEQADGSDDKPLHRSALHPNEVGIRLFRRGETGHGSGIQEIPFDHSEGVEPAEYDDVAEQLYNRAAYLQNKLEESRDDA